jgi:sulfite reductase alpha subunit-like flavoprotein
LARAPVLRRSAPLCSSAQRTGARQNWLFFGNPHFTEDFLYQVEWQSYVKEGLLTRIDLAWSRDQQQNLCAGQTASRGRAVALDQ